MTPQPYVSFREIDFAVPLITNSYPSRRILRKNCAAQTNVIFDIIRAHQNGITLNRRTQMSNLTLRSIPDATMAELRSRAASNHRSINGEILAIIEISLSGGLPRSLSRLRTRPERGSLRLQEERDRSAALPSFGGARTASPGGIGKNGRQISSQRSTDRGHRR